MGERLTKVKDIVKNYEIQQKEINKKYSNKDLLDKIEEIDRKLKPSELHIQRLEEELSKIPESEKDLIAEYKKKIDEEKNPKFEDEVGYDKNAHYDIERRDNLAKKQELLKELKDRQANKDNEKNKQRELLDLETKQRASLTQEKMSIDNEIEKVELNMQMTLMDLRDFKYEYEEKDGVKIPKNGGEFKAINDKYARLQDGLQDLKDAKKLCETKLEEFKQKDEEKMQRFSKAWNASKKDEEKVVPQKKPVTTKKVHGKIDYIEIVEKDGQIHYKDELGNEKELSTKDINKKKLFKDSKISDICENAAGTLLSGLFLKRKVNPSIVAVLKDNPEQLKEYIVSLRDKEGLPFELVHDLKGISLLRKFRLSKFTRLEEKLGAKVLGKMFDKNRSIDEKKGKKLLEAAKESSIKVKDKAKSFIPKINNKDSHIEKEAKIKLGNSPDKGNGIDKDEENIK